MSKRLLLIYPGSVDKLNVASIGIYLTFAPPTLACLAGLTPSDWGVRIADENVETLIAHTVNRGYNWFVPMKRQHVLDERAREMRSTRVTCAVPSDERPEAEAVEA